MGVLNKNELVAGGFDSAANDWTVSKNLGVDLSFYGSVTNDITTLLELAFADPNHSLIKIPSGSFNVSKIIVTTPYNKAFIAQDDTIITWTGDDSMITINPGEEWVENVSSITTETGLLGIGATVNSTYSVLTLSGSRQVNPGELYKIVSDDPLPLVLTATDTELRRRAGENVTVGVASSGNTIKLTGVLQESYTTGIKLIKYRKTKFSWTGGQFTSSSSAAATSASTSAMFKVLLLDSPTISNIKYYNGKLPFVYFGGCYDYKLSNAHFENLVTNESLGQFGYTANIVSSESGLVENCSSRNCRHNPTDNMHYSRAGDGNYYLRGRPRNNRVVNSNGKGMTNSTVDTHEAGNGTTFVGMRTSGNFAGPSSGGLSSNARGRGVSFIGERATGNYRGLLSQSIDNLLVNDCEYRTCQSRALEMRLPADGVLANGATGSWNNRIKNCVFETSGNAPVALLGDANANGLYVDIIDLSDTIFKLSSKTNQSSVIDLNGVKIRGRNITIDCSEYVATSSSGIINIFRALTNNNDVEIDGLTIIPPRDTTAFSTSWASLCNASVADNTSKIYITNVKYVGEKDFLGYSSPGGNMFGVGTNLTGDIKISGSKKIGVTETQSSKYIGTNSATINISKIADDFVFISSNTSTAQTVTVTATGKPTGHRFKYMTRGAGSQTVNGTVIAQGQTREFIIISGTIVVTA